MTLPYGVPDFTSYWEQDHLTTIIPNSPRFGLYPEGWDVVAFLRRNLAPFVTSRIVEVGCGYGRLCGAFDPNLYLGLDINAEAVEAARARNPDYCFEAASFIGEYPSADLYLVYTVLLHVDDSAAAEMTRRMCAAAPRVAIAEILGERKSVRTAPPIYKRQRRDYEAIMAAHDFVLEEEVRRPYHYYSGAELSCLLFRRKQAPPSRLTRFPQDLGSPDVEFTGLFEDGWTTHRLTLTLTQPEQSTTLSIRGLVPLIDEPSFSAVIEISVDGLQYANQAIGVGEFELQVPVAHAPGAHAVTVSFSATQRLPAGDGRVVSALLRFLGFEAGA